MTEQRPCVEVVVEPGPDGLTALLEPLRAAIEGTGPAVALVPGGGSAEYRAAIRSAVRPGEPVAAEVAVVVSTSGSTGNPAGVLLPGAALRAAARAFAERSEVPGHQWVAALPLHHTGGLMVAARAVLDGTRPVAVASLGGAARFTPAALSEATRRAERATGGTDTPLALSLVPAQLATVAEDDDGLAVLRSYHRVLVGGAGTPAALASRLRAEKVRLTLSYGMSETCGGAVFDGAPLPGMTATVERDGRLLLTGSQVAAGYRDGRHPERWGVDAAGRRSFQTEDLGSVTPDGTVSVLGRADDVVQVGGASVALSAVADVLRSDSGVAEAHVCAVPDERFGATVVALVVPERGACAADQEPGVPAGRLPDRLARLVADRLGSAARPRRVRLLRALPMLESGKPDRQALAELAARALR